MNQFIFVLDSPFLKTAADEALALAESVLEETETEVPEKFYLCREAALNMKLGEAVTQKQLQGLCDAIGGYYCATDLLVKEYAGDPEQLKHAEELVRFADSLIEKARLLWKLEIIK